MFRQGFFREHASLLISMHAILDISILVISAWVCYELVPLRNPDADRYLLAVMLTVLLGFIVFNLFSLYSPWRNKSRVNEIGTVVLAMSTVFLAVIVLMFLTKSSANYSRLWTGFWFLSATSAICFLRIGVRSMLHYLRSHGYNLRQVVIFSEGNIGEQVLHELHEEPQSGYRVLGYFSNEDCSIAEEVEQTGSIDEGIGYVEQNTLDQLWLAMPLSSEKQIKRIVDSLPYITADVRLIPDFFGVRLINHSISQIGDLPIINLSVTPMDGMNRFLKEIEDKLIALLILLVISPLLLALAIGVKLSSPGPIFYRQERVSWNGRSFGMYKFRSMPVNAEDKSGPVWATSGEARATKFGTLIRKTSLDELPQFWNVLVGDMSIVGPRPERPVFVDKFKQEVPGYMQKHMVKAGITGWAQVNGWRGDTDIKQRITHDLYYIENWSLLFDFKIILQTLFTGFVNRNAY
jgi:putative colanic acid biosysnthesis UDP-glucose lipid carrier transferase